MDIFRKGSLTVPNQNGEPKHIENVYPIKPNQPQTSGRILGIDVSHYEPAVDWQKAKAGGVGWMYTKATEGTSHVDLMMHKHVMGAKSAGIPTGVYHFFHASKDGDLQAQLFLSQLTGLTLELAPCLDWESGSADGMSSEHQQAEAMKWLARVEKATGRKPIIYGGESFLRELKLPKEFAKYDLWLAHYGVKESAIKTPAPWNDWLMWQYTDAETVPGLASGHHVDANWLKGSDLKALLAS